MPQGRVKTISVRELCEKPENFELQRAHDQLADIGFRLSEITDNANNLQNDPNADREVKKTLFKLGQRVEDHRKSIIAEANNLKRHFPLRFAVLLLSLVFLTGCGQRDEIYPAEVYRTDGPNMFHQLEYKAETPNAESKKEN